VNQSSTNLKVIIPSVLLSIFLAALPVYLYYLADAQADDDSLFVEGAFFWCLGLTFIFSSRYAKHVYLLYLIDYAFTKFAVVGGKYRTLIYGVVFCVVGIIQQIRWLTAG